MVVVAENDRDLLRHCDFILDRLRPLEKKPDFLDMEREPDLGEALIHERGGKGRDGE